MDNKSLDREQLMITIDQLDQTLEVLSSVMRRLKYSVNQCSLPESISTTAKLLEAALDDTGHCH